MSFSATVQSWFDSGAVSSSGENVMPRRADARSCRCAGWWPHMLGALAFLAFGSAAATSFRGLTLDQALRQLQHQGLNVLYSSALVRPSMEVRDEPAATAH